MPHSKPLGQMTLPELVAALEEIRQRSQPDTVTETRVDSVMEMVRARAWRLEELLVTWWNHSDSAYVYLTPNGTADLWLDRAAREESPDQPKCSVDIRTIPEGVEAVRVIAAEDSYSRDHQ